MRLLSWRTFANDENIGDFIVRLVNKVRKKSIKLVNKNYRSIIRNISVIVLILLGVVLIIFIIVLGYNFNITGFNTQVETVKPGQQIHPAKTLWDWMQLLIVPIVLTIGAFSLNWTITRNEQRVAQKRFEMDYKIAVNAQQENLLQNYLDKMTELLIHENILEKQSVRNIASARTVATISRLDETLQATLFQFLYNAGLIKNGSIHSNTISLKGVNIENSDFFSLNLSYSNLAEIRMDNCAFYSANFEGSNLNNSEFFECDLSYAIFRDASIINAYLTQSVFEKADFSRANLYKTRLARTNLRQANLAMANLREALLDDAYIYQANLSKANLSKAILVGADLTETILKDAILKDADLTRANLSGVDLTGADLTETILKDAILDEKTVISQEQLSKAKQTLIKRA